MADENPAVEVNPPVVTGEPQPPIEAPAPLPALAALTAEAAATTVSSGAGTPGLGTTGTLTPMIDPEQIAHSLQVSLADLSAKATALYAHKSYEVAAEVFAQAAEMQAEINGEMNPANAEILFLYGRCLYKVGQSKSDVFGGKAPDSKKKGAAAAPKAKKAVAAAAEKPADEAALTTAAATEAAKPEEPTPAERITEEGIAIVAAEAGGGAKKDDAPQAKKPLFQFVGDENWDDSDEEEEDAGEAEGEAGEEEEDDDLAVAFEILDMARVLYNKKLEELEGESAEGKGKEKDTGDSAALRHVKERLADTHDILAEISLEGERFHAAIPDSRKSLAYKKDLYSEESEIIAEAHFKLSLALEYASINATDEEKDKGDGGNIDQALRDEAATELEAAIKSTKSKLQSKEVELATNHSPEDNDLTRKEITDVKELIADMEQRLVDLRGLPMDVDAMLNEGNPLGGILGAALGETPTQVAARVEEAKKTANDLTSLVRKKPAAAKPEEQQQQQQPAVAATNGSAAAAETNGNGIKRKLDETEPEAQPAAEEVKKAKVEEPVPAVAAEAAVAE